MRFHPTKPLKPSYWQDSLTFSTRCPAFKGEHRADVAIIGGGFVGLWTALNIKQLEPDCTVVILEQDICGGGASGRNGGLVMSWWPKIGTLKSICNPEQALFLARSAERAIIELGEFCQQHAIDAQFVQNGWLWTATTSLHVGSWNRTLQICEDLGVRPFERICSTDLRRRTGSSIHLAGIFEASNATVQPAALVQGMCQVALESGIRIYEQSAVRCMRPGSPALLQTDQGQLKADKIVLATNAWSAAIPELARIITPVNSSIVVTQPVPKDLEEIGWTGGESITDSQMLVDYYRTTPDGRIAFGKGTGVISYRSEINQTFSDDTESIAMARADLFNTYPFLKKNIVAYSWSGPIDRTYDSLPVFGRLAGQENIFYGVGWSGNGVGPSRLGGRILASLALARQDEWSRCGLVERRCKRFPSDPIRFIGGNLVRNAVICKEEAEMKGRRPTKIQQWLASLAPSGLEDK
ncbi:FAD-dependent oxidoreductase [Allopusillimonas soli]|uniref:FAD-dependent oxidoreductase n=1 Tax=Allopusillimonas soli TaxID=659016 RepID=A0A853FES5_9BURK|nr:FAD-binding oxidoreductase [Allopusillimonas soli]NYT38182.1 FAD-dependent oxidoreductase [Allopusillimonas soli]TEA74054.1 FAD-dependent oxidoreductase [Allopusillimonas soli]